MIKLQPRTYKALGAILVTLLGAVVAAAPDLGLPPGVVSVLASVVAGLGWFTQQRPAGEP